ncbi:NAD-dependent epimerase/dehydratase family protein [Eudoraea chungangensis]|uniref:NAD-dependent epimerase/dehydratase family protein n=1 Tax=Eudoraea chungangensis TaxID=1481905 RepID=UPI0023ED7571|nr:NAD-dependent epimerase/dehydratase family protein [Eudoraea chungangensis]
MILVTGGTGLIGSHLLWQLVQKNVEVKAIYRNEARLEKVLHVFSYYSKDPEKYYRKINWVKANLSSIPDLEIAFKQIKEVYHCAALISFDPNDFYRLQKSNKIGTENIVNLCLANKIKRLCYLSSIATLGRATSGNTISEEIDWTDSYSNVYALSKHQAEMEVWRGAQEGLPVCILNPGIVLGPGFWRNGSGLLFKIAAKKPNYYPPGATGFVSVEDLTNLMILAMNSTIKNERYIVVSENLTYKAVLDTIAKGLGVKPASKILKNWQLQILWRLDWFWSILSSRKRRLTKNTVYSLNNAQEYNNGKVKKDFSYAFKPINTSILKYCTYYKRDRN